MKLEMVKKCSSGGTRKWGSGFLRRSADRGRKGLRRTAVPLLFCFVFLAALVNEARALHAQVQI